MTRLIDADALKNTFKDKEGNEFTAFHFYEAIEKAPTVEQRPHGEWKPDGTCSECGVYSSLNKNTAYFCPNCGADMREGETND